MASLVEGYLKETVARVLHIEQARLEIDRSLNALGMDSMMAVELKNRIEQGITVNISVVDLLQGASVTQLASLFIERIQLSQADEQDVASGDLEHLSEHVDDETLAQLLQQIERMSPEELQEQLASAGKQREVGGEV